MDEHLSEPPQGDNLGWDDFVPVTAKRLSYPPTPDIAGAVGRRLSPRASRSPARRLAWALAVVVLVLAGLLAVPEVRAYVVELLRIGAIQFVPASPTPAVITATPAAATTLPLETSPAAPPPSSPAATVPAPTPTLLASLLNLAGQTTLEDAQERVPFPIRLPQYPPDLGTPNYVFVQDLDGPLVVLAWTDADRPDHVRLSLHEFGPGTFAEKGEPRILQQTTVHGQTAYWTEGPHVFKMRNGDMDMRRLVTGHVLIWVEGRITYRLETDLPLEQALPIAESIGPPSASP